MCVQLLLFAFLYFLNTNTVVQKVKWFGQAHLINPEFTLNHWVIESLRVERYEHLKFWEVLLNCFTKLYQFIPPLIMHVKKKIMHVSVCGPHLGQHKLWSCFNTFFLPVRWDHLQFMKSGFQIYEIKLLLCNLFSVENLIEKMISVPRASQLE